MKIHRIDCKRMTPVDLGLKVKMVKIFYLLSFLSLITWFTIVNFTTVIGRCKTLLRRVKAVQKSGL